jgi:hypothetical protein
MTAPDRIGGRLPVSTSNAVNCSGQESLRATEILSGHSTTYNENILPVIVATLIRKGLPPFFLLAWPGTLFLESAGNLPHSRLRGMVPSPSRRIPPAEEEDRGVTAPSLPSVTNIKTQVSIVSAILPIIPTSRFHKTDFTYRSSQIISSQTLTLYVGEKYLRIYDGFLPELLIFENLASMQHFKQ